MARPWSRKRNPAPDEPAPLGDDDHAWWAQDEVKEAWRPRNRRPPDGEAKRDILAEHFGDDWRTSFGFTPPTEEEAAAQAARDQQALDDQDPYKVLGIDASATWEEIVAAHRHQARTHHPDLLVDQSDEERERGEERIRVINVAYQELRVRRGM